MPRTFRATIFLLLLAAGYSKASAQTPGALRVAAAADLQPVLPAIAAKFEQQNHMHVDVTYGASGTLAAQIENGAPFDVFLAADMKYPERIISGGFSDTASPILYAHGVLVLWARKDSPVQPLTLDSLRDVRLKRLAIANPKTAPYGSAAMAALEKMGLASELQKKLVTAENIAQAAQFAESGNADAGLISLNAASSAPLASEGTSIVMPTMSYPPIKQGAIVLRKASNKQQAQYFIEAVANAMLHANGVVIQPTAGTVQH